MSPPDGGEKNPPVDGCFPILFGVISHYGLEIYDLKGFVMDLT
jgi:hypothetical protein